mgnify:CR=1 FL=1|jgi:preprotein translocase subunit SecB
MLNSSFERIFFGDMPEEALYDARYIPSSPSINEDMFGVKTDFNVVGFNGKGGEPLDKIFEMDFTYQLIYSIEKGNPGFPEKETFEECMRLFIERNSLFHVWPYAREFVSSSTIKMGFPPVILDTKAIVL